MGVLMKINKIIFGLIISLILCPTKIVNSESLHSEINQEKVEIKNTMIYSSKIEIVSPYIKELSQDEIDLISRVVMAEAEDEPFEGKIYVIDTILNRVESKHFPNTVHDVIYQRGQFTSMWNGRFDRCSSNSQLDETIKEENINRKNSDVIFFTADHYGENGKPSFRVGNHYFATY
jgi:N-acetylmuramoyl-L-alanine amidase